MDTAKILVVDDQIDTLRFVSTVMRGAGYQVLEASDGAVCLRLAMEQQPDLILLDVVLPDIDGREVCRLIKSNTRTAGILVVLFSSILVGSDDQSEGLEQGADGYITKPIRKRELMARVRSMLRLKSTEEALRESERKYRLLAENTQDVIWQTDLDLVSTYVNPAIARLTGHTPEEWIGTSIKEHCDAESFAKFASLVSVGIKGLDHSEVLTEAALLSKDGVSVPIEVLATLLYDENGLPIGLQGVTRDITERKKVERKLQEVNESLEQKVAERTRELEELNRKLTTEIKKHSDTALFLRESQQRYEKLLSSLRNMITMLSDMLQNAGPDVRSQTLLDISKNVELNYIETALRKTGGKVQPAAKLLGITRSMLNRQIAKMGIKPSNYK